MRRTVLLVLVAALGSVFVPAPARAAGVVLEPVAFSVDNVNRSLVPCAVDGRTYTVRGTLARPEGDTPPGVTLYLHGSGDARTWHVTAIPGYDHIAEMAKLGHASVFIDQLGYGASDIPHGDEVCAGSEADIAAQIADQLRSGDYVLGGGRGLPFTKVGLAGHSMGGGIAEAAAYSFPDTFDAVAITGWSAIIPNTRANPQIAGIAVLRNALARCTLQPEGKWGATPANGYAFGFDHDEIGPAVFYNGTQEIIDVIADAYERDACANIRSLGAVVALGPALDANVTAPVLIVLGDRDIIMSPEVYAARFSGSDDVSILTVPDCGHMMMLERPAPGFRASLSGWLAQRGL